MAKGFDILGVGNMKPPSLYTYKDNTQPAPINQQLPNETLDKYRSNMADASGVGNISGISINPKNKQVTTLPVSQPPMSNEDLFSNLFPQPKANLNPFAVKMIPSHQIGAGIKQNPVVGQNLFLTNTFPIHQNDNFFLKGLKGIGNFGTSVLSAPGEALRKLSIEGGSVLSGNGIKNNLPKNTSFTQDILKPALPQSVVNSATNFSQKHPILSGLGEAGLETAVDPVMYLTGGNIEKVMAPKDAQGIIKPVEVPKVSPQEQAQAAKAQQAWQDIVDTYKVPKDKPLPEATETPIQAIKESPKVNIPAEAEKGVQTEIKPTETTSMLEPHEQKYLDYLKQNNISLDTAIKGMKDRYEQLIKEQIAYMKSSVGKGADKGGLIQRDGEVVGAYPPVSNNPEWYSKFLKENGKKPNNAEYRELAVSQLKNGFNDIGGKIPPNKEFNGIENALPQIENLQSKVGKVEMAENPSEMAQNQPVQVEQSQPNVTILPEETNALQGDLGINGTNQIEQPKLPQTASKQVAASKDVTLGASIPGVSQFVEHDIVPATKSAVSGIHNAFEDLRGLINPRSAVDEKVVNKVMELKGAREKQLFEMEQQMKGISKMFTKMPEADQVDFIDRFKRGEAQKTPELQEIANQYAKIDQETFNEALKYKPTLAWKENHFRVFWKTIPGNVEKKGFSGLFKRPLQGTKGFMKQSTLADISEGIAKGGVPITTNPQRLFEMAQADMMKFISAQKMFSSMKDMGVVKFVKPGGNIPEDFTRLNDSMAKVYFPTPAGMVQSGEYYIEKNAGRMLNNYLSKNLVQQVAAGRGLAYAKNVTTAWELSFSPFHATFETLDSISSKFGVGLTRAINQGIVNPLNARQLPNIAEIGKGIKDMATAIGAPVEYSRLGGSVIKYVANKQEFLQTLRGQKFIQSIPDADKAIDALFNGGGKLAINEEYRLKSIRSMQENWNKGNWIGAGLRSFPALSELLMKPLFETYIPRLKIGLFLRDYGQQLEENGSRLMNGEVTEGKIARDAWDRTENKLGEMNFDNLFWNNTFKAGMQVAFRSVTWKLGSMRGFGGAVVNQLKNFGDIRYGKIPKIDPGMSWMVGVGITTATLSSIIQYLSTGEHPKSLMDLVFPRVGGTDKDGNPNRISIPTYFKDAMALTKNPVEYIKNSASSVISKSIDAMQNKDYFGDYIYNPDDPLWKKFLDIVGYEIPKPFSLTTYQQMAQSDATTREKVLGGLGFVKAPRDYTLSRFEIEVANAYGAQNPHVAQTTQEKDLANQKADLKRQIFYKQISDEEAKKQAAKFYQGSYINTFVKNAHMAPTAIMFKGLKTATKNKVLQYASPDEIAKLRQAGLLNYQDTTKKTTTKDYGTPIPQQNN